MYSGVRHCGGDVPVEAFVDLSPGCVVVVADSLAAMFSGVCEEVVKRMSSVSRE